MMKVMETERLLLRWLELEDAAFIFQLLNEPGWLRKNICYMRLLFSGNVKGLFESVATTIITSARCDVSWILIVKK
ncbi:hypothetical protein [Bacillus sp. CGMCC 1.16541]|uniref:hypothetical protein n=1 Tax=Bacillus sp. CGMCC 1.16541 TaxID=2185143 RepID=UPI00194E4899|nr:hypothetical protein [Bacillus sp. CGMCC 1.16541]